MTHVRGGQWLMPEMHGWGLRWAPGSKRGQEGSTALGGQVLHPAEPQHGDGEQHQRHTEVAHVPDPPRADEVARCDDVLRLLRLDHLADAPIERLSLGQCRLVEVGRALMTEPKVLLLDEPSSGLDRAESASLAKTLQEVQAEQGFSILLVEHDVELVASFTTRSYVLDFGRVIVEGPTRDVLASAEVRAAYLGDLEETR